MNMNKAQKLLAGLEILDKYGMDDFELTPIPLTFRVNPNTSSTSAYLSIHVPYPQCNDILITDIQALCHLGWASEQEHEYWIFRD